MEEISGGEKMNDMQIEDLIFQLKRIADNLKPKSVEIPKIDMAKELGIRYI